MRATFSISGNESQPAPGCSQFITARELYQPNFPNKVYLKLGNKPLDIIVQAFALFLGNGPALQAFFTLPDIFRLQVYKRVGISVRRKVTGPSHLYVSVFHYSFPSHFKSSKTKNSALDLGFPSLLFLSMPGYPEKLCCFEKQIAC